MTKNNDGWVPPVLMGLACVFVATLCSQMMQYQRQYERVHAAYARLVRMCAPTPQGFGADGYGASQMADPARSPILGTDPQTADAIGFMEDSDERLMNAAYARPSADAGVTADAFVQVVAPKSEGVGEHRVATSAAADAGAAPTNEAAPAGSPDASDTALSIPHINRDECPERSSLEAAADWFRESPRRFEHAVGSCAVVDGLTYKVVGTAVLKQGQGPLHFITRMQPAYQPHLVSAGAMDRLVMEANPPKTRDWRSGKMVHPVGAQIVFFALSGR